MSDTIPDFGDILKALRDDLRHDTRTKDMAIKIMGRINTDPSQAHAGWVGLYANSREFGPRTIGSGVRNWRMAPTINIVVQAVHAMASAEAFYRLEDYIKAVLDVVLANRALTDNVDTMTRMVIDYSFSSEDDASLHFEGAVITLSFEGRSN